ncbi:MAG: hypothetical protein AABW82_04145 [Nanoarchaeota archaeon]
MDRLRPVTPSFSHAFTRLLNDVEIERAIRDRSIYLDRPEVYLDKRRKDLIQPASMDLLLLREEETEPILSEEFLESRGRKEVKEHYVCDVHPNLSRDFITFWPGHQTEVAVMHLQDWSHDILAAEIELRSTLRRAGLDIGFNPFGLGRQGLNDYCFFSIRNPQSYPVSIEKGAKIAQLLWLDRRLQDKQDFVFVDGVNYLKDVCPIKFGSGIPICNNQGLLKLIESGDLGISPRATLESGVVVFHSGNIASYNGQQHVVMKREGKPEGISVVQRNQAIFNIEPGQFVDIETREKIRLSNKVGMHVYYSFNQSNDMLEGWSIEDVINDISTKSSSGGWVDPGYGSKTPEGAVFSAQRKAFTKPITIREGDPIAVGIVYYFPKGVGLEYGCGRGSHYDGASKFLAPKG